MGAACLGLRTAGGAQWPLTGGGGLILHHRLLRILFTEQAEHSEGGLGRPPSPGSLCVEEALPLPLPLSRSRVGSRRVGASAVLRAVDWLVGFGFLALGGHLGNSRPVTGLGPAGWLICCGRWCVFLTQPWRWVSLHQLLQGIHSVAGTIWAPTRDSMVRVWTRTPRQCRCSGFGLGSRCQ